MVDFNRNIHCLMGLPIDAVSVPQAAHLLRQAHRTRERCFFSTPNLNFVIASLSDATFRDSVCRSDLSLADGMPLVWVARLLGIPVRERVSGSSLFEFLRKNSPTIWKVFFFGGPMGTGQAACLAIGANEAVMRPTGYIYPGFASVEQMSRPDLIECINESQSDMLVVSLGAAKGQAWICENLSQLRTPVVAHLGAVVNFVAGKVARAPLWMQRAGLEWMWRIMEEPALLKRYAHDGAKFLKLLTTHVLPLAIWQRWIAPAESEFARAYVAHVGSANSHQVTLVGAWRMDNLGPVRGAFTQSLSQGRGVTIEMSGVTGIDSAFIGLLLVLDRALISRGTNLRLINLQPHLQRLLRLSGVNHLILE